MSSDPLFSVIIPSRNRPDLLHEAVQSVLLQTFPDFELIISNNGDPLREDLLASYVSDSRVRYRVSPSLTMEDHWEEATLASRGEYILLLTDRCVLCNGALTAIAKQLQETGFPDIISWRMRIYLDRFGILLNQSSYERVFYGEDHIKKIMPFVLRDECLHQCTWSEILPRALNCAVKASFIDTIRSKYGRVFFSISPDISFAMTCLFENPALYFTNSVHYISRGISSGGLAYSGFPQIATGNTAISLDHVPCKAILVNNMIIDDYLSVSYRCGHYDALESVDLRAYYRFLSAEFKAKVKAGRVTFSYLLSLRNSLTASAFNSGIDQHLVGELYPLSIPFVYINRFLQTIKKVLFQYFYPVYRSCVRLKCQVIHSGTLYSSALQAAGHKVL